jgi:hypothetical protein
MVCISEGNKGGGRIWVTSKWQELLRRFFILLYLPVFCFLMSSVVCIYVICTSFLFLPFHAYTEYPLHIEYSLSNLGILFGLIFFGIPSLILLFHVVSLDEIKPRYEALFIIVAVVLAFLAPPKAFLFLAYISALFYATESIARADPTERTPLAAATLAVTSFSIISLFLPSLSPPLFLAYISALFYGKRARGTVRSRRDLAILAVMIVLIFSLIVCSMPQLRPINPLARTSFEFVSPLESWGLFLTAVFFTARVKRSFFMWGASVAILLSPLIFYNPLILMFSISGVILLFIILVIPLYKITGKLEAVRRCITYACLMWIAISIQSLAL